MMNIMNIINMMNLMNIMNIINMMNTDASIFVYKFRPERTGFNYVRRVYATAINFPCIITLVKTHKTL